MIGSLPVEKLNAWASQALLQYPLRRPSLHFLGHSDNITFRVEDALGGMYLLRLHRPSLAYWVGIRQLPEVIASELTWLEALAEEGDCLVQRPVHALNGKLVGSISPENEAPLPVTLLSWLEGAHFSPAAQDAPEQVHRLGALVGRLHDFSEHWTPPAGFIRPQYDLDHFRRIFARLLRGVDLGVFSEEIFRILRAASQAILTEIELATTVAQLPDGTEHWGVIHADLHVGNFLIRGQQVAPIDFSFCGWGHYLFDLSVCLAGGLNAPLRPIFLAGYREMRSLPESSLHTVDAYTLAGMMSYYAYQIDNPAERAWLQRRIPEVALTVCSRFIQGESVLGSL